MFKTPADIEQEIRRKILEEENFALSHQVRYEGRSPPMGIKYSVYSPHNHRYLGFTYWPRELAYDHVAIVQKFLDEKREMDELMKPGEDD